MTTKADATPIPERSLNRQLVLEEDEYSVALSQIIARDFFPNLVHLDATNEYLDALSSRDPHLIGATVRRLQELNDTPAARSTRRPYQTPSQTPYGFGPSDTPLPSSRRDGEPPAKKPKFNTSLSLDEFQARYTSEDNSSFTQILDEENRQRKEKWGWAWDAQRRVEESKMIAGAERERMLIEPPPGSITGVREKLVIEAPKPMGLITAGDEEEGGSEKEDQDRGKQLALSKGKEKEEEALDVMAPKKDVRSAGVEGWNFKARNSLMFPPDANSSPYHQKPKAVPPVPSGEERSISYGSTRLPEQEETTSVNRPLSAPPSPTRSRIDAAIHGTPYHPRDTSLSTSSSSFSLVPSIPSPTPEELGPAAVKQLMTWGTLNATPRIISSSDDDPALEAPRSTPFHLPAPSSREALSHRLSANASKSLRAKAGLLGLGGSTPGISSRTTKGSMAPPSWTPATRRSSQAAGNLTPAAKRLLSRTMTTGAQRRSDAMEKTAGWGSGRGEKDMNKVRWTPTPGKGR